MFLTLSLHFRDDRLSFRAKFGLIKVKITFRHTAVCLRWKTEVSSHRPLLQHVCMHVVPVLSSRMTMLFQARLCSGLSMVAFLHAFRASTCLFWSAYCRGRKKERWHTVLPFYYFPSFICFFFSLHFLLILFKEAPGKQRRSPLPSVQGCSSSLGISSESGWRSSSSAPPFRTPAGCFERCPDSSMPPQSRVCRGLWGEKKTSWSQ